MSNIGLVHGSILVIKLPGKKPISSSSTETKGRVMTIFLIWPFLSAMAACMQANNVFPDPAGPITTTIAFSSSCK